MMIDSMNAAALYAGRHEDTPSPGGSDANDVKRQGKQPEEGRTSEFGPAVVSRLSAAALETARAVAEPGQGADTNRAAEAAAGHKTGLAGNRQPAAIDVMV